MLVNPLNEKKGLTLPFGVWCLVFGFWFLVQVQIWG